MNLTETGSFVKLQPGKPGQFRWGMAGDIRYRDKDYTIGDIYQIRNYFTSRLGRF